HKLGATSGRCFDNLDFAVAIVNRAKKVGAATVLAEVNNYINSTTIRIECGLLMYNTNINNEFRFSNGVRLVNTSSLNDHNLLEFLSKERISTGGVNSSFLVTDYETPKQFFSSITGSQSPDFTKLEIKSELIQILDDTRLILALSRNPDYGIPVVASFEIIPDNLEIFNDGIGYSPFPEPRNSIGPTIIELEMNRANELLDLFNAMNDESKDKIRIAMKRLNDSKIDSNWPNKCINLRICLENLFHISSDNFISKSISERMPLHTSISKTRVKNIYSFLSSAVHSGRIPEHDNITVQEIITAVQNVIIQFIRNGDYPNWISSPKKSKWQIFCKCIKELFK
ncbi:MAG: hypothetical protein AB3N10_11955, partial [Allomuricauda sp.]